jgi:ribonucleoside-diphosphate reductase alpha chain
MKGNEGYINVVSVMQKYFDQAISGNWSYNPLQYTNNEVPLSAMATDLLTTYKYGWKTSYYQNTYDFKGEEEEVQPAGIGAVSTEDEGEDVELPHDLDQVNGSTKINSTTGDDAGECEACTI